MPDDLRVLAGRYRLETLLGRGGMGQVWQARDEMLGRPVAVKEVRFPTGLADDERDVLCQRTMREARLGARLSHPGIVTVYDVVSQDGRPFIVMELIRAPSLADVIDDQGPLPPQRVAVIGVALLKALEVAHREGIVHRDVKPSNVLLDQARVVLTDFGIATSESDATLTATGLLIGSPTYMSPERLRSAQIGPPADLWSLGATLYAALEAHPPFRADTTMGTITAVLTDDPPPPHVRGPLAQALLGLLEKSPQSRLTAQEVLPLLQQAAESVRPPPPPMHPASSVDTTTVHVSPAIPVMSPVAAAPLTPQLDEFFGSQNDIAPAGSGAAEPPRRRPGLVPLLLAVVIAILAAGVVLANQLTDNQPGPSSTPPTTSTPSQRSPRPTTERTEQTTDPTSEPTAEPTSQPTTGPTSDPTLDPTVPSGYQLVSDDEFDFSVAVPLDWERRAVDSTRVDFLSPDGSSYLRVDQRAEAGPSAEQAWIDYEPALAQQLSGYSRIRLEPVSYRGWEAADLEFTYEGSNGTVHAIDRGFITNPRGFALFMVGPDATWDSETLPVFEVAAATFQPRS